MGLFDFISDVANNMIRDAERRGNELEREARKRGYSSEQISAGRQRYDERVERMRDARDGLKMCKDYWTRD